MKSVKLEYLEKHYKENKNFDLFSYNGKEEILIYNMKTNSITKLTTKNKRKFNNKDIKIFSVL